MVKNNSLNHEPSNCVIVVSSLTNKTTHKWQALVKGVRPAGYNILMRETYQPLWEKKVFVTGNEVTLPYSKDNFSPLWRNEKGILRAY